MTYNQILEIILTVLINLGSFFYIILTTVLYLFAFYCIQNRKTLKLGFSKKPATTLDLIIIVLLPIFMTLTAYNMYHEFNTN